MAYHKMNDYNKMNLNDLKNLLAEAETKFEAVREERLATIDSLTKRGYKVVRVSMRVWGRCVDEINALNAAILTKKMMAF